MDIQYLLWLQNIRESMGGSLDGFFLFLSKLPISFVALTILALIYWSVDNRAGIYILMNYGWGNVINQFLKTTVCLYRPWIRDARITPVAGAVPDATGYSFPSGHTVNASTIYGGLAKWYRKHKVISIVLVVLVLLIGLSRNYLGVHHPQDVIVGLIEGFGIVFLNYWILNKIEKTGKGAVWYLIAGLAFAAFLIVYDLVKPYPMDYIGGVLIVDPNKMKLDSFLSAGCMIGTVLGWYIDRRWIKFTSEGSVLKRIIRFVIGMGLFILIYDLVFPGFLTIFGPQMGRILASFVLFIYITCIFPLLDEKVLKKIKIF